MVYYILANNYNISRSKDNQTMKLDQLIDYNKKKIFSWNIMQRIR